MYSLKQKTTYLSIHSLNTEQLYYDIIKYHTIHPFKAYNLVVFIIFRDMQPSLQSILLKN